VTCNPSASDLVVALAPVLADPEVEDVDAAVADVDADTAVADVDADPEVEDVDAAVADPVDVDTEVADPVEPPDVDDALKQLYIKLSPPEPIHCPTGTVP